MFHVKRFTTSLLLLFFFSGTRAQYTSYSYSFKPEPRISISIDKEIESNISTQALSARLSSKERDLLYWMDFARKYPARFYDEVVNLFVNSYPEIINSKKYINTLRKALYTSKPLPLLVLDERLLALAKEHARDVQTHNNPDIAHNSSNGLSFQQRAKEKGINTCASENISYGGSSTLMQLVLLYLDIGQPSLGHRKNLLNPSFTNTGIALVGLNANEVFFVQDLSCSPN
jgi:Uncharacterized protein with SCP/PR1 domains